MTHSPISRRAALLGGGALLLTSLAACQTARTPGTQVRASSDGAPHVASVRSQHGLSSLRPDRELETAALQQAVYMAEAGRMTHDTGWGRGFSARMGKVKTNGAAAENLAVGRMDTARVVTMWMNSPGHRRNMLNGNFSRYGLAYVADAAEPSRRYWAMVLAA